MFISKNVFDKLGSYDYINRLQYRYNTLLGIII